MTLHGMKYKIPVFIGLASLASFLPTAVLTFEQNQWLELHVAYWTLLAMLCGWLLLAIKYIRANHASLKTNWRRYAVLLALSLILTAILFTVIPKEFRILSDETNLLSVSQNLFERRQPVVCLSGEYRSGRLECLQWRFDKRLHFYPFLVHIAHHVTGFRLANAFAVNFLAGTGILLCVGLIAGRLFGRSATFAAPVLLASIPAMGQSFASGGSETVNLALLLLAALLLLRWSATADRTLWGLLVLTYALLCHVRLESPAYLLAGLPLIALRWRSAAHRADICSWHSALAPLIFLPLIWHYELFADLESSHTVDQVRMVEQDGPPAKQTEPGAQRKPQEQTTATEEPAPQSIDADSPHRTPPEGEEPQRQPAKKKTSQQRRTATARAADKISASLTELSRIFSGANLWRNTRKNLGFLFSADRALPNSAIVSTLAAIGLLGGAFVSSIRWKQWPEKAHCLCAAALPALLFFRNLPSTDDISGWQNSRLFYERQHLLAYLERQSGQPLVVYGRSPQTLLAGYDTWKPIHALQNLDQLRRSVGTGRYTRILFVWGMDCQDTGPVMAGISYNTLCTHFLQQFEYRELARLVTEGGHVVLILELRP